MLEIVAVPAFSDNYIWLVHDPTAARRRWSIRAMRPGPAEAERRGWTIGQVWNTHWHWDHTGGNLAVKQATGCTISGPAAAPSRAGDVALGEGERSARRSYRPVIAVPGHTLGPHRAGLR
jgi:hydroxyacylglutathione hydrolase